MSKWDKKEPFKDTSIDMPVMTMDQLAKSTDMDRKERLVEWTFQLAKTMISTNRYTISVIPASACNLAKEIDSYLQSVGLLPNSLEESQS